VLRASAVCELAGVPTASLTAEGFILQASFTAVGLGLPNIPVALVPGHPGGQTKDELRQNILTVTLDRVIDNLTRTPPPANTRGEPKARDIVVKGGFQAVNRYFVKNDLSDGLPIVPPTTEAIESFLRFTDRDPDESLGVLLPDSRAATVWSIAVNGVMAGCRPEYMPVLVAAVEAMCDPVYANEHSGNTPGGETLITINGPIIKQLGFNYEQGALRDGFQPNTSIGRFWRLYLRNVAGFLPHRTDKATHGNTWRVVLAENEDVLAEIGWEPNSVDLGFAAGDNTVTAARYTGGGAFPSVMGDTPERLLPYITDSVLRMHSWQLNFTVSAGDGSLRPLVVLSPIIARTIAKAGWSKADVKEYLYQHARMPAGQIEHILRDWTGKSTWSIEAAVDEGRMPAHFLTSTDPERMVPIVWKAEDFMIVVSGDPLRDNSYVFAHNAFMGYPTAKKIELIDDWEELLAKSKAGEL
jgi:hypothetical protein